MKFGYVPLSPKQNSIKIWFILNKLIQKYDMSLNDEYISIKLQEYHIQE